MPSTDLRDNGSQGFCSLTHTTFLAIFAYLPRQRRLIGMKAPITALVGP